MVLNTPEDAALARRSHGGSHPMSGCTASASLRSFDGFSETPDNNSSRIEVGLSLGLGSGLIVPYTGSPDLRPKSNPS